MYKTGYVYSKLTSPGSPSGMMYVQFFSWPRLYRVYIHILRTIQFTPPLKALWLIWLSLTLLVG